MYDKNKHVLLIINPVSGRMRSRTSVYEIAELFCKNGYWVTLQITTKRGDAEQAAKFAAESGHTMVVCCGGDGTLNEVATGMMSAKNRVPIGYIPSGTTNDFASSMKIPANIASCVQSIISGGPIPIDIGSFNSRRRFTYIASFGAFTAASYSVSQSAKNIMGHVAYILEGIRDISKIRPLHIKAVSGLDIFEGDYVFGAVSNSISIGGIVKIKSEIVDMSDGLFEIFLLKMPKNASDLQRLIHGVINSDIDNEMIDFFQCSNIDFFMPEGCDWSLDGEYTMGEKNIHIENNYHALSIITKNYNSENADVNKTAFV